MTTHPRWFERANEALNQMIPRERRAFLLQRLAEMGDEDPLEELQRLHAEVNEVFASDVPWEVKYDLIFNHRLSQRIHELISLDYYDPDTSYEEDVRAFVNALNEKMKGGEPRDLG